MKGIFRNAERERAILDERDLSYCRRCGSWDVWHGMDQSGTPIAIICARCGWVCGQARVIDGIAAALEARLERLKKLLHLREGGGARWRSGS